MATVSDRHLAVLREQCRVAWGRFMFANKSRQAPSYEEYMQTRAAYQEALRTAKHDAAADGAAVTRHQ